MEENNFQVDDAEYVIYRNSRCQCRHYRKRRIVQQPKNPEELALFLHDAYNPLAEDDAVFSSFEEAEEIYNQLFDYQQYD
jgi:transcriptional regulator of the spore photoproduct lyase operon